MMIRFNIRQIPTPQEHYLCKNKAKLYQPKASIIPQKNITES